MRLIDADLLCEVLRQREDKYRAEGSRVKAATFRIARALAASVPKEDAEPIRRGKWVLLEKDELGDVYICSECGKAHSTFATNVSPIDYDDAFYCERCGAKMEVEHETD